MPEQRNNDHETKQARCTVCHRACDLSDGVTGACRARKNIGGVVRPVNYGLLTSIALDPIEKKPLSRFMPGKKILSVGSFGCNLKCPFCQNCEISCARMEGQRIIFSTARGDRYEIPVEYYAPEELCALAYEYRDKNNVGVAFTYNEPLVGYEYVRDTAALVRNAGMKNVLVTAGCVSQDVLMEILPYIDAMNIDLKSFSADVYRDFLGGDLETVKAFIETAARRTHVELTTLIVPEKNDTEREMEQIASWIASLNGGKGEEIPLHVTRYFPRHRMTDTPATDVSLIYRLKEIAERKLRYVYAGNC